MKKILIIEDDFYISKLYNRTFTLSGFQADTATSGKEALEKGKINTYDIILLDVMLGDMTGMDVLKAFKAEGHPAAKTPIFLSTNRGEDEIVKEGFSLGIEGYFLKSQYVPQDIVAEINTFFSKQGAIDEVPNVGANEQNPPAISGVTQNTNPTPPASASLAAPVLTIPDGQSLPVSQPPIVPSTNVGVPAESIPTSSVSSPVLAKQGSVQGVVSDPILPVSSVPNASSTNGASQ